MTSGDPAAPAVRRELQRKVLHVATAVVPVGYAAGIPRRVVVAACGALLGVALLVELARRASPSAAARFATWTGPLLRPHEAAGGIAGATWLLAAFTAVTAGTAAPVAIAAMWGVAAGDGAAAIVGRTIGRIPLVAGKTLEGTLAMALVTAAGAWSFAAWPVGTAALLGGVAAAAELPARPLNDNLRVALAVAAAGSLMITQTH